jgi:hypothetical protein
MQSKTATQTPTFEARQWREASHSPQPDHCEYSDTCKARTGKVCECKCFDCNQANAKPTGTDHPALWGVYDVESGVRIFYADATETRTSEEVAKATAEKWNAGTIPATEKAKAESARYLRKRINPGDTVSTIVRNVSRSGMARRISLFIVDEGKIDDITWEVARVMGDPIKQRGQYVQDAGLFVSGCGMDMCFHTVYNLGRILFPDGFGEEGELSHGRKIRPQTREQAAKAVEKGAKFRGRNGDTSGWDTDGGYALKKANL